MANQRDPIYKCNGIKINSGINFNNEAKSQIGAKVTQIRKTPREMKSSSLDKCKHGYYNINGHKTVS